MHKSYMSEDEVRSSGLDYILFGLMVLRVRFMTPTWPKTNNWTTLEEEEEGEEDKGLGEEATQCHGTTSTNGRCQRGTTSTNGRCQREPPSNTYCKRF